MKTVFTFLLLIFFEINFSTASPKINFSELLEQSEANPGNVISARLEAMRLGLPVNILTSNKVMIDAKAMENGKIVYAVIKDLADVYNGGYTAYYEDIIKSIDINVARIDYGNGNISDNTNGMYNPVLSDASGLNKFLMIPDWTFDRVYLFRSDNGDLVDTAFIVSSNPHLQSPKHALPHFNGRNILVSDQISDLVQKFDTNGSYISYFAPSTGVNTAILDNMRGIRYRANRNLLVTVASGGSQNTIQQFDTAGNHLGTFITGNLNSPFDILFRNSDILITNSSGANRITKFDLDGNFISAFYSGTNLAFPQQMYKMNNGNIVVAGFSSPSGLIIIDSAGNYLRSLTGVTGNRSAYLLGNGNFMTTNGTGVHEIDSASGALVRTIVTGANYQYVSEYRPDIIQTISSNFSSNAGYELYPNYPNPFNPSTVIKFSLPENSDVILNVYDVNGKLVSVLHDGNLNRGNHEFEFNAYGLPSGVYFYKLQAEGFSETKSMLLVK